jgi:hypothetical protein
MTTTPLLLELTSRMGLALFKVQSAELSLKLCITWLGAESNITLEQLEAREQSLQKKTLGFFIRELKAKIEFDPIFENTLVQFLRDRNLFAHELREVPGFSLNTDMEILAGIAFVKSLTDRATAITRIVMGFNNILANPGKPNDSQFPIDLDDETFNEFLALTTLKRV